METRALFLVSLVLLALLHVNWCQKDAEGRFYLDKFALLDKKRRKVQCIQQLIGGSASPRDNRVQGRTFGILLEALGGQQDYDGDEDSQGNPCDFGYFSGGNGGNVDSVSLSAPIPSRYLRPQYYMRQIRRTLRPIYRLLRK